MLTRCTVNVLNPLSKETLVVRCTREVPIVYRWLVFFRREPYFGVGSLLFGIWLVCGISPIINKIIYLLWNKETLVISPARSLAELPRRKLPFTHFLSTQYYLLLNQASPLPFFPQIPTLCSVNLFLTSTRRKKKNCYHKPHLNSTIGWSKIKDILIDTFLHWIIPSYPSMNNKFITTIC